MNQDKIDQHYKSLKSGYQRPELMDSIFNAQGLMNHAEAYANLYQNQEPYPYIALQNILPPEWAEQVEKDFPLPNQLDFYRYDNPLEKKMAFDQVYRLPDSVKNCLYQLNSPVFLNFLEKLTGIEGLIPDPYFRGGGVHLIPKGGKLDVHVDFNIHPKLKLHRRLNVLVYLNKKWKEEWDGDLQIWEGFKDNRGDHHLLKLHDRIYPNFNTFVCFNTSEKSYHGFPNKVKRPANIARKSIALYYYTAEAPKGEADPHSTVFVKRPTDNDELDELRKERAKGRISSNVDSDVTS